MSFLYCIEELNGWQREDIRLHFGGKALGLYEAFSLHIPIPKTYLIQADWQKEFSFAHPNWEEKTAISWVEEKIGLELSLLPDNHYAVRSSAKGEDSLSKSYAGIFDTCLNVPKEELVKAIVTVWLSACSLRVRSYEERQHKLGMGVIIQPMVETKWAGIAFSKNPSPKSVWENEHITIEIAPIAGEKIVQGEITPFCLSGTADQILHSVNLSWMGKLLAMIRKIKRHFCYEIDLEFVVDNQEKVWLLQQRPISKLFTSYQLDLSGFIRKYKRALLTLDIELLIEGCNLHLGPYLEIPFPLHRWMIMTTSKDHFQEIWVNKQIEETFLFDLESRIEEDSRYLFRIQRRYEEVHRSILQKDYERFSSSAASLSARFLEFKEWAAFLEAHYYVPLFMADALYSLLHKKIEKIDENKSEEILFFLGTFAIRSIMDLLRESLTKVDVEDEKALKELLYQYGFLKCREFYEEGYSLEEFIEMAKETPTIFSSSEEDRIKYQAWKERYLSSTKEEELLTHFRYWMKVRNQEMEFLYFALHRCRKLYEEIAETLQVSLQQIWKSSSEAILQALEEKKGEKIAHFPRENLVIYYDKKKVHLSQDIILQYPSTKKKKALKGKTIYGKGVVECIVKIVRGVEDLVKENRQKPYALVTGMTTPDFVPYLSSHPIRALITDEGGILCHAAIIAREASIPCIVGTHIATECLQSGDKVQIDFDRGELSLPKKRR